MMFPPEIQNDNFSMDKLSSKILTACERTDCILWRAYNLSLKGEFGNIDRGHLLFPKCRSKKKESLRVSEQEARFAFVESLHSTDFLYSVETPTSKLYQFTGKTRLSAQSDLAIHDQTGRRICNVEFKAKGISHSARQHDHIYKDFQKLLREPVRGLWFHFFR